ncbi:ryanodine receptor 1 [Sarotherodon galilaeus]
MQASRRTRILHHLFLIASLFTSTTPSPSSQQPFQLHTTFLFILHQPPNITSFLLRDQITNIGLSLNLCNHVLSAPKAYQPSGQQRC